MKEFDQLIHQLENQISNYEKINLAVSQSSIGWHIDHSLMVINGIVAQLKKSNPQEYKWKFNWKRVYIQTINKIPRGKGKAPKAVQPTESISVEELAAKLKYAKNSIAELEILDSSSYFSHPYFGDLNLKTTVWFLKLHTNHHLKIISDINNKV